MAIMIFMMAIFYTMRAVMAQIKMGILVFNVLNSMASPAPIHYLCA
jgi:hypothetical protein